MVEGIETVEFEVQLNQVPVDYDTKIGKEVICKWQIEGFDNEGTFYTDSNGLEMQKRVINSRPDYTTTSDMTVSNNYYPINSAIAMRDLTTNSQVTIMNTRSQGGSAVSKDTIELMQNRRLLVDDNLGVDEPLNEMNADGVGLQTIAKYQFQYHSFEQQDPVQRPTQLITDQPLMYFFGNESSTEVASSVAYQMPSPADYIVTKD